MRFLTVLPAIVSCLLLAAHFLRSMSWPFVGVCLVMPFVLLWSSRWAVRVMQGFLILGTLEWSAAAYILRWQRMQEGQPWVRGTLILAGVAGFTFASMLLLQLTVHRRRGNTAVT